MESPTPRKGGLKRDLAVLATLLFFCLPPMLVSLGTSDSTNTMENIAVLSAQETWMRQEAGESNAWLMPSVNEKPRVTKPPMLVWLDMLAWKGMRMSDGIEELIWRARLVSVATGLVMLASIYWMGITLGDRRYAVVAVLVAGSMWFVQRQCRYGSYDIQVTAWVTLSIAAALWAMRPFGAPAWNGLESRKKAAPLPDVTFAQSAADFAPPSNARWLGGWIISGVALAMAWLTKGPLALVLVLLPLLCLIAVLGKAGMGARMKGLLVCLGVALLLTAPWYVYAYHTVPEAGRRWTSEAKAIRDKFQVPYYYLCLFFLVTPWTLWLFSGLVHPFVRSDPVTRRRRLLAFVWFASIFIFFSIPGAKQQRYILPIIPAAALLIAQVFRDHEALAETGEPDKGVKFLCGIHWFALIVVSLLMAPLLGDFPMVAGYLSRWDDTIADPSHAFTGSLGWPVSIVFSLALLALAIAGWRSHAKHRYTGAACTGAAWALLLTTVFWHAYEMSPKHIHPIRAPAEKVAAAVGHNKLRWLTDEPAKCDPNEEFLIYGRFTVQPIAPGDVVKRGPAGTKQFVMTLVGQAEYEKLLEENGFVKQFPFASDTTMNHWLWLRID